MHGSMSTLSPREHAADRWVHVAGLGLGAPAALGVVLVAALDGAQGGLAPVSLYAAGLLAMLGCSAAYNLGRISPRRSSRRHDWLRRLDHAAIFVMIAGTYTPFTLKLERSWALGLTSAVWALAAAGVTVKLLPTARSRARWRSGRAGAARDGRGCRRYKAGRRRRAAPGSAGRARQTAALRR